jgi:hypothetical protein
MKFRRIQDNIIVEVTDKLAIARYQGYPDLFEEIKEVKEVKEPKIKSKKEE